MKNILWILAVALFAGHELDAVAQAEWRLLYGLRALEPAQGRGWFIALHVPLCAALMLLAGHRQARIRRISRRSLAGFSWSTPGCTTACKSTRCTCSARYRPRY